MAINFVGKKEAEEGNTKKQGVDIHKAGLERRKFHVSIQKIKPVVNQKVIGWVTMAPSFFNYIHVEKT